MEKNAKDEKKLAREAKKPTIDFTGETRDLEEETADALNVDALGNKNTKNIDIEVKVVLTKEEKEVVALEAKVKKELKKNGPAEGRKASKNEMKLIKLKIKRRRDNGDEEVYTDEEVTNAGFDLD